jgi:predicted nucleic acid-binding protein
LSAYCIDASAYGNFRRGNAVVLGEWIAATAARHGASVLTFDEHFQHIGRVGSVVVGV